MTHNQIKLFFNINTLQLLLYFTLCHETFSERFKEKRYCRVINLWIYVYIQGLPSPKYRFFIFKIKFARDEQSNSRAWMKIYD